MRNEYKRWIKGYLLGALVTFIFGCIYEIFSHGVISLFMVCAFLVPLLLGAHPLAFRMRKREDIPGGIPLQLQACSIASLTAWMIVKGILEIYGTTNSLCHIYLAASFVTMTAAVWIHLRKES